MFEFVNHSCNTSDILILSSPLTITDAPMAAGAILKSIAEQAGFSCSVVDLNILTMRWVVNHSNRNNLVEFFDSGVIKSEIEQSISQYTASVIALVKRYNPKILGLSVFTYTCREFTALLCKEMKHYCPNIQIILGGAGIADVSSADPEFAENLQKAQLIDHYIKGDAEQSFYEFLKGNQEFPGINGSNWKQLVNHDLATLPYPNYDDYKWSWYGPGLYVTEEEFQNSNKVYSVGIPITGSKGCVRKCTFCDYIVSHKQFTWRTAENIFDEIMHQRKKYGQQAFNFTDSLINGNMKEYRRLIEMLANYNDSQPASQRIRWYSQFIMRPKDQFKEELWELTARSGAQTLAIGIESFDDQVIFDMGKSFTNKDIDFGLSMMKKYGITTYFMVMIGYVTETQDVYDQVRQWLQNRVQYKDIMMLGIVGTVSIIKNTYLDKNQNKFGVIWLDNAGSDVKKSLFNWATVDNKNTPDKRTEWLKITRNHAVELGFKVFEEINGHVMLSQLTGGPLTVEMIELHREITASRDILNHGGGNIKLLYS
jgi:hypothetical protein